MRKPQAGSHPDSAYEASIAACPRCASTKQVRKDRKDRFRLGAVSADLLAAEIIRADCGAALAMTREEDAELVFARFLHQVGAASGAAFCFVRKSLKFSASDLAALLKVRAETISRWENDQGRLDRAAWIALGAMVEDRCEGRTTTEDRLRAALQSNTPKEPVELQVPLHWISAPKSAGGTQASLGPKARRSR